MIHTGVCEHIRYNVSDSEKLHVNIYKGGTPLCLSVFGKPFFGGQDLNYFWRSGNVLTIVVIKDQKEKRFAHPRRRHEGVYKVFGIVHQNKDQKGNREVHKDQRKTTKQSPKHHWRAGTSSLRTCYSTYIEVQSICFILTVHQVLPIKFEGTQYLIEISHI